MDGNTCGDTDGRAEPDGEDGGQESPCHTNMWQLALVQDSREPGMKAADAEADAYRMARV